MKTSHALDTFRRHAGHLQVLAAALTIALNSSAQAQPQQTQQPGARGNGAVFPLPPGVSRVIAIDAHNSLIAELEDEAGNVSRYAPIEVRHVYAGGIARLFGGEVVPTEQFVSPAFNNQNGNNGGNGNGFGNNGQNGFGNRNNQNQNGFGAGFNGGGNGFNQNGGNFGQPNFGQNGLNQNNLGGNFQMQPRNTNNAAQVWRR